MPEPPTNRNGHCQGFRKDGSPCQSPATSNASWCFWHDPERPEAEKHEAAQRGGLSHQRKTLPATVPDARLRSPAACLLLLEESVSQVRRGELDIRIMNSISYAVTSAVRVWEVLLSDRIDKLEKLIHGKARRR
jgi:hypothetical protein